MDKVDSNSGANSNPAKKPIPIGIWADKKVENAYDYEGLVGPDADISADFEASIQGTSAAAGITAIPSGRR